MLLKHILRQPCLGPNITHFLKQVCINQVYFDSWPLIPRVGLKTFEFTSMRFKTAAIGGTQAHFTPAPDFEEEENLEHDSRIQLVHCGGQANGISEGIINRFKLRQEISWPLL